MQEEASIERFATLANQIRNNINYFAKMQEEAKNERSATLANQIRNNIKNIPKMEEETRIQRPIRPYQIGTEGLIGRIKRYHELLQEEARNERSASLANQIRNNIKNIPKIEEMRHHESLEKIKSIAKLYEMRHHESLEKIKSIAKIYEEAGNERSATLANQIRSNIKNIPKMEEEARIQRPIRPYKRYHELLQEEIRIVRPIRPYETGTERPIVCFEIGTGGAIVRIEARNERSATLANQIRNNIKNIPKMEEETRIERPIRPYMRHHESLQEMIDLIQRKQRMRHHELLQEAFLNADTSEVKMIFGKQEVHFSNRHSCHGTKLLKSSLSLAPFFLPSAGGAGHGSGQAEHQGHSEIYPSTLNVVSNCPSLGENMQKSLAKCADVCGSYMQDGNCAYHCMRDSSKTKLVEFCAKPKPLFDFCPEYDPVDQTIQKDLATLCNSTFSGNYYNSSDIYFCDPNNCLQLRESSVRSGATTLTTLINETTEMNGGDSQELFLPLMIVLAALLAVFIIGCILFVRRGVFSEMRKKRNQNEKEYVYTRKRIPDNV